MKNALNTILFVTAAASACSCGKHIEQIHASANKTQSILNPQSYHLTIPAHQLPNYHKNPTGYGQHDAGNQEYEKGYFPDTTSIEIGGQLFLLLSTTKNK